jgi:hypothetical protein
MTRSDVFALKNSGLERFLFAEVGTEMNGSTLTVLSVLARLGQDPWDQAAQWVSLPKATIIDRLTKSIAQMPLSEQALRDVDQTANRLILLLPVEVTLQSRTDTTTPHLLIARKWSLILVVAALLAAVIGVLLFP